MAALGKPAVAVRGKNTKIENRRRAAIRLKPATLEKGSVAKSGDDFIIMSLLKSESLELREIVDQSSVTRLRDALSNEPDASLERVS
jgi:hypothetical protein